MIITIDYQFGTFLNMSRLSFPWGEEELDFRHPEIGWRTADPLSGEWELIDWERSSSGFGKLTFAYHPAPAPDSLADIAARDAARLEATGVNDPAGTYKAWVKFLDNEPQVFPVGVSEVQRAPTAEQPIFAMTNRKLLEKIHDMLVKAAEQKRVAKLRRGLQHMRDFAPACYDTGGPGREMVDAVSDLVRHLFGPEPK